MPDEALFEHSGFRIFRGDLFQEAKSQAANELMRRNVSGETTQRWDNTFFFEHPLYLEFEEQLRQADRLLDLEANVPLASWVLARLRRLFPTYVPERASLACDGGGYSFDFYVLQGDTPVSWLQLQGNMGGIDLIGDVRDTTLVDAIARSWEAVLLQSPADVDVCVFDVFDPGWEFEPEYFQPTPDEHSRNWYGWDGQRYLGADNIREVG